MRPVSVIAQYVKKKIITNQSYSNSLVEEFLVKDITAKCLLQSI